MFRQMRRKAQVLPEEVCRQVLDQCTAGVLAVSGDDDYPYAVPLSYVMHQGILYFHCAKTGHKLDAIQRNSKVSFCVIDQDQNMPAQFTTYYRSVIVFGKARLVEDDAEKREALVGLVRKYSPDFMPEGHVSIQNAWSTVTVVAIDVDQITGKEARELAAQR